MENRPIVAACEGPCEALAEEVTWGAKEAAGLVGPVCAEVDEEIFQEYLQRKKV